jgi:hypothetical protein
VKAYWCVRDFDSQLWWRLGELYLVSLSHLFTRLTCPSFLLDLFFLLPYWSFSSYLSNSSDSSNSSHLSYLFDLSDSSYLSDLSFFPACLVFLIVLLSYWSYSSCFLACFSCRTRLIRLTRLTRLTYLCIAYPICLLFDSFHKSSHLSYLSFWFCLVQ